MFNPHLIHPIQAFSLQDKIHAIGENNKFISKNMITPTSLITSRLSPYLLAKLIIKLLTSWLVGKRLS